MMREDPSRRTILSSVGLTEVTTGGAAIGGLAKAREQIQAQSAAAADAPNVIVVLLDDLGYSDLGCYGGEIATPHIDAMASGGAQYTNFRLCGRFPVPG